MLKLWWEISLLKLLTEVFTIFTPQKQAEIALFDNVPPEIYC